MWALRNIPKIAHFYWGGDNLTFLRFMSLYSFRKHNKDWKIILHVPSKCSKKRYWSNKQGEMFVDAKNNYMRFLERIGVDVNVFDEEKYGISHEINEIIKSDLLRYIALHEIGGIWSDIDILYIRSVDNLSCNKEEMMNKKTFLYHSQENYERSGYSVGFLMSSINNNHFYKLMQEAIIILKNYNYDNNEEFEYEKIGSRLFYKIFGEKSKISMDEDICFIGKESVYALDHTKLDYIYYKKGGDRFISSNSIGVHWYGGELYKYPKMMNLDAKDIIKISAGSVFRNGHKITKKNSDQGYLYSLLINYYQSDLRRFCDEK